MLEAIYIKAVELCNKKSKISLPMLQYELNMSFTESKKCMEYLLENDIVEYTDKGEEYKIINKKSISDLEKHNTSADKKRANKNQGLRHQQDDNRKAPQFYDGMAEDMLLACKEDKEDEDFLKRIQELLESDDIINVIDRDESKERAKDAKQNTDKNEDNNNFVAKPDTEKEGGHIKNTIMECRHNDIIKKLINKKYGSNKNNIKIELDKHKNDINLIDLICKQLASGLKLNAEKGGLILKVERGKAIILIEIRKVGKYFTILDNGETVKFLKSINLINSEQQVKVIRRVCDYYGVGIGEKDEEYTMYQIFTSEEKLLKQVYLFYSCISCLLGKVS